MSFRRIKIVALLSIFIVIIVLVVSIFLTPQVSVSQQPQKARQHPADPGKIVVDYTSLQKTLDPNAIGMDLSGYGQPNVFVSDQTEQQELKTLNVKYMRIELKYSTSGDSTSKILCGADGCDKQWSGDQWIQAIRSIGAEPLVIVNYSAVDAANMVRHFNKDTNNYVRNWMVGNEPDRGGISADAYSANFNGIYEAMKAVDPTIKIGGGATAWYDAPFLQTFLQQSGSRVDFVDFHGYAQEGNMPGNYTKLFQLAAGYGNDVSNLRSLIQQIVPDRASQIGVEVGEWELNWGGTAQDDTNFHTIWTASVLGHILSAGGWSLFYADKGNAIYEHQHTITDAYGHVVKINVDDTNPAYHGIGIFTGEGLFRGFGDTLVNVSTKIPNIEVYASDNPKNIVVINKDPSITQTVTVSLKGVPSGAVDVWRKDESVSFPNSPVKLETLPIRHETFTYRLTPFSTTAFVVNTTTQISSNLSTPPSVHLTPKLSSTRELTLAQDTFQRTDQAHWGNASDGQAWSADANNSQVFSIVNHNGQLANGYSSYNAIIGPAATNAQVLFSGSISSFQYTNIGSVLRWTDSNNWYKAYIDGSNIVIQKKVDGSTTNLNQMPFAAQAGISYTLRFSAIGSTLTAKVWQTGSPEPDNWQVTATDNSLSSGYCGLHILIQTGTSAQITYFIAKTQ